MCLATQVAVSANNDWAVVVEIWYTFPGKINVYWNEAFVPPTGRRDQVTAGPWVFGL